VQNQLKPPATLRAIIVGGARLQPELYSQAQKLGWPLLPSFGMTETASMIATAKTPRDPTLHILTHMQVSTTAEGYLQLEGPSLFTPYAHSHGQAPYFEPRPKPFITEDRGTIEGLHLILHGRDKNFLKIGGESVDLTRLERIFEEIKLEKNFL